ncbi:Txe/YoeB family addiction module toxin [Flavobacterium sp.]|uniref:Txe/YoeB family addiction module toxin n=1 Tax=Flavobacterium sp. TaxID=239 RepID=UPI003750EB7F
MGKFRVEIEDLAILHITKHLKFGNKSNIKRINKILSELIDTTFIGTGNPEALKYQLTGFWSRQINKKDRLIYKVDENIVTDYVISAMGHYSDI